MGKTHVGFGMLFAAIGLPLAGNAFFHFSIVELVAGILIGAIAGVLPDIDHPDSLITHGIIPGGHRFGAIGKLAGWMLSIPPRFIGLGVRQTMNHRGGTHSLLFGGAWALLAAPLYAVFFALVGLAVGSLLVTLGAFVPLIGGPGQALSNGAISWVSNGIIHELPLISLSIFLGYLAHLVSDSLTKVPVPWLWPFSKRRFFLAPRGLRIRTDGPTENWLIRPLVYLATAGAISVLIVVPFLSQHHLGNSGNSQEPSVHSGK